MKLRALTSPEKGRADDSNNKPNRRAQLLIVSVVGLCVWFGWSFLNRASVQPVAQAAEVSTTPAGVLVVTATPTPTVEPTQTPAVLYAEVTRQVEVTREVTRYVTEFIPVEVTRLVTVTVAAPVVSTPTPPALAPGTLRVCADVQGARELYIGGQGIVAGECRSFAFGVGQTSVQVQVNK